MKTSHKVIIGDSRKMKEIEDKSIHLVITSPPYWQLKDYGKKGQIGFNDAYEDYINNLNLVGSKIDNTSAERELYYAVKEIITPEMLILNNDLKVSLLGVKAKSEKNGEALQFLHATLHGKKVYIKFDSMRYDENHNLLCYLYLRNKTFINAHLIRRGLVDVDTTREYTYKSKFLSARPV